MSPIEELDFIAEHRLTLASIFRPHVDTFLAVCSTQSGESFCRHQSTPVSRSRQ